MLFHVQYVKMVHNGIEYGDMQLICEAYDIMKRGLQLPDKEIAEVFKKWNKGVLDSFLIEIVCLFPSGRFDSVDKLRHPDL